MGLGLLNSLRGIGTQPANSISVCRVVRLAQTLLEKNGSSLNVVTVGALHYSPWGYRLVIGIYITQANRTAYQTVPWLPSSHQTPP